MQEIAARLQTQRALFDVASKIPLLPPVNWSRALEAQLRYSSDKRNARAQTDDFQRPLSSAPSGR